MTRKDDSSADSTCPGHVTLAARMHGRQLVCFRPKRRFRLATAALKTQVGEVELACHCERQVLQCLVDRQQQTESELDTAELLYRFRLRKWNERFAARDWAHERVCQKWKENHKRFTKQQEDVQNDSIASSSKSPSASVRMVLSSFASAAELRLSSRQFDVLLKTGVSPQLRGQVWWMCSGAAELRREAHESYPALLHRLHTLSKCAEMDIEKDLPRTFPLALCESMPRSQAFVEDDRFGELRRVLQAYSLRNPMVGYCQSMNFLAAVLLQHMGEEETFWVLSAIVEELTPQYHTQTMTGSRADQRVFSDLVAQKLPVLATHLHTLDVDFEPFTLKWFLCLFLNTLPFEPVLRLWDIFFCEGSHVLLRMGLVLLKLNQSRIMACTDALDVYEMFTVSQETLQLLTAPYRAGLLNRDECVCDTLIRLTMDKSFVGTIPFDTLHELRDFYRCEIEAELKIAEAQRLARQGSADAQMTAALYSSCTHNKDRALMLEYDFVDDYACCSGSDVSPALNIRFMDLYDSDDSSADYFVDVMYDFTLPHSR